MEGTEEERNRRISRILTIDEIINPPGGSRRHPVPPPPLILSANNSLAAAGNPNAGQNFMRINHGQVSYTPGIVTIPELESPPEIQGIKNPAFVGSSASVHNQSQPNVRCVVVEIILVLSLERVIETCVFYR